jgi:hypothetical protein
MKHFVITLTVCALVAGVYAVSSHKIKDNKFSLSGQVQVASRLIKNAQANNVACAVIAKNEADVPIAIKRIINPQFPVQFNLSKEDLLLDSYEGNLKLEVQINSHGKLGVLERGDIFGAADGYFTSGQKDIVLYADKMIGTPTLTAGRNKSSFFRTAAR